MSEAPAPYNAGDEAQVKTRKRREDREQLRNDDAAKYVMKDALGRHFIYKLMDEAGLYKQPYAGNSSTDYNCGRLSVALRLKRLLETQLPREYLLMQAEHLEEQMKNGKEDQSNG